MNEINKILSKYKKAKSSLIEILHDIQANSEKQYLSEESLKLVSEYLNISLSSVYGTASYYSMFSLTPRAEHIIRICKSPVCNSQNSCNIRKELMRILKIDKDVIKSTDKFVIESVECLGHCEKAPVMMINDKVYGSLNSEKIQTIIKKYNK